MPKEDKKTKSFVLRIDAETMDALERWAADEFRSTNGQLQWIINEALKKHKRTKRRQKMNEDLNDIRLPRTKESTISELVLAVIIIIEGILLYTKSHGDTGVMTISGMLFLAAAILMAVAYRPKWINMPVTVKNFRQVELKSQSARVIAIVVALFPACFVNPQWMVGASGTVIGIVFTIIVMAVGGFYIWKMEKAGK